jgi:hypothetical protein
MYNALLYIDIVFITSRLQRYDIILNVVSVTYGKDANKVKAKSAANQ